MSSQEVSGRTLGASSREAFPLSISGRTLGASSRDSAVSISSGWETRAMSTGSARSRTSSSTTAIGEQLFNIKTFKTIVLFVADWICNSLLLFTIKKTVSTDFPHPFMLTCLINTAKVALAVLMAGLNRAYFYMETGKSVGLPASHLLKLWLQGLFTCKAHLGCKDFSKGILPIGILWGVEVGCSNTALHLLSVSLKTMIQSCSSAAVLLSCWLLGLEKLSFQNQFVVLLVMGGGALSARYTYVYQQEAVSDLGLALAVLSIFVLGFRVAFTQKIFQRQVNVAFTEHKKEEVLSIICGDKPPGHDSLARLGSINNMLVDEIEVHSTDAPNFRHFLSHLSEDDDEENDDGTSSDKCNSARTEPLMPYRLFKDVREHAGLKVAYVSKPEVLMLTLPPAAAVCLVLALIREPNAFNTFLGNPWRTGGNVILCAVYAFAKLDLDLKLIELTSAFTFILSGIVNDLFGVLIGVLFFDERPFVVAWLGFGTTSLGMVFFAWTHIGRGGGTRADSVAGSVDRFNNTIRSTQPVSQASGSTHASGRHAALTF